jgi:hypothetical protein
MGIEQLRSAAAGPGRLRVTESLHALIVYWSIRTQVTFLAIHLLFLDRLFRNIPFLFHGEFLASLTLPVPEHSLHSKNVVAAANVIIHLEILVGKTW